MKNLKLKRVVYMLIVGVVIGGLLTYAIMNDLIPKSTLPATISQKIEDTPAIKKSIVFMKGILPYVKSIVTKSATNVSKGLRAIRTVTLTWEPNSEPDLSHYIVYWGTATGTYTSNSGNIGLVTEYTVTLPDDNATYFFAVTAVDEAGLESDFSNEVNTAFPRASAGNDQAVSSGRVVTLDGSATTDPKGTAMTYSWTQTSGTTVVLSSKTAIKPTFTAPTTTTQNIVLVFSLEVTNAAGYKDTDTCTITITPANQNSGPPTAPSAIRNK